MASSFSLAVLRLRNFRLMLCVRTFALMALQAQSVIVGWQVYSLTHNPFMLGLTGLAEALPAISCALFAGHVVDVTRPYIVYASCICLLAANTLALLLFAGGIVPLSSDTILICIFSGIFISGIARSFLMPSSFSLLPQIVARSEISSASAWLSSGFQMGAITGPALAGIVYGGYGARGAWFIPVTLICVCVALAFGFSSPIRQFRSSQKREPAVQSIRAGWGFIIHNRVLLSIMALDMFAVLFGGAVAMLPAYADKVLHIGSQGLGELRAAPALGAIISAVALAIRPFKIIRASVLLWVITGFGVCMIGFGLSTVFWISVLLLAASGAFDSVSMVIRQTLMQLLTPDAMRGRVSAINSMFIISSNEIGAFESGVAATLLGLVPSVVFGGAATLVVVAVTAWISPKLRALSIKTDGSAA